jgi:hypothetical protein
MRFLLSRRRVIKLNPSRLGYAWAARVMAFCFDWSRPCSFFKLLYLIDGSLTIISASTPHQFWIYNYAAHCPCIYRILVFFLLHHMRIFLKHNFSKTHQMLVKVSKFVFNEELSATAFFFSLMCSWKECMQETKLGYFKECRDQTVSAERGLARARSFLEISQEQVALASFYFLRRPTRRKPTKSLPCAARCDLVARWGTSLLKLHVCKAPRAHMPM